MNTNNSPHQKQLLFKKVPFLSIRAKMLLYFGLLFSIILLIIELIELFGIPFTNFSGKYGLRKYNEFQNLSFVADLKKERLLHWIEERKDDARVISHSEILSNQMTKLQSRIQHNMADRLEDAKFWSKLKEDSSYILIHNHMTLVKSSHEVYDKIQIADALTGNIIYSTHNQDIGLDISSQDFFKNALIPGNSETFIAGKDPQNNKMKFYFSCKFSSKKNKDKPHFILIMHINTEDFVKPLLFTSDRSGQTGEVFLVNQEAKIITTLKHPLKDGTTAIPLEYQTSTYPAVYASQGHEGIVETEDYRGVPVLAAFRHIRISPEIGWGLVIKKDQSEIFAGIKKDKITFFIMSSGGILLVIFLTMLISNNLSKPIRHLSKIALQIKNGNYNARASRCTTLETCLLSTTFNSMIDQIQKHHEELEEKIHLRTKELKEINKHLQQEIIERKHAEENVEEKTNIIRLIHEITVAANEGLTVDETILNCLQKICQYTGWSTGHAYQSIETSDGTKVLKSTNLWYCKDNEKYIPLKVLTDTGHYEPCKRLSGKVYESKQAAWISDITMDNDCNCVQKAKEQHLHLGIRGAFAFPILEGNSVTYILEFFSKKKEEPQKLLLEVITILAIQLGRVTERKRAEENLRKLSQAVEQSASIVLITDRNGMIEYANPKFMQVTGYAQEEVFGQNPRFLKTGKTPVEEYKRLWDTISSGKEWQGEFYNKKKNGETYWEKASISPVRTEAGEITHFIAIKEDITEQKKLKNQLLYMANHDPLTNLFNRRRFHEELEHLIAQAQRYNTYGALLFLDIDNFKYVNDTLGHLAGDELLIKLARLLRERMRKTDIISRLGGDEFAIILPYTKKEQAVLISRQISALVSSHLSMKEGLSHLNVSLSIGIVVFPEHGDDVSSLLSHADIALYKAKEQGRNRVCVFSPEQKTQLDYQVNWNKYIKNALNNNRFLLHFQPIMDLNTRKTIGYEALIRMIDEKKGLVLPEHFLSIAERFGTIQEIDLWVVTNAIRHINEYQFDKKGLFLDINLSGMSFNYSKLLKKIKHELEITKINPGSLIIEITETTIIENMIEAQNFIDVLTTLGCRFALDDFGIGFTSFNYLKHLHVNYLKIDGSFIKNLPHNSIDTYLVKAIVDVAKGLKKQTIAEYTEDEETIQLLKKLGVDFAQGYYIGVPKPITELFSLW